MKRNKKGLIGIVMCIVVIICFALIIGMSIYEELKRENFEDEVKNCKHRTIKQMYTECNNNFVNEYCYEMIILYDIMCSEEG